ncbi:MAG: hypothetical protein ACR2GC_10540 [Methyloceanibacter sp.]|uniref:hypothetical protein n=1 Tax=Methyloceanibacter sp. TaxID=1965321 RepID=UPI003D9B9734
MANWWDAAPEVRSGWESAPEIGATEDFARSMVGGVERSVLGMQGTLGDTDRAVRKGAFWAADKLGFGPGHTVADRLGLADTTNATPPESVLPSTQDVTRFYEQNVGGPIHNPQTTAGEYGRTIGEYLPAAFGGPQSVAGKVAAVAVPALASETAGQVARRVAPGWEKSIRVGTGLVGSLATMRRKVGPSTDDLETAKRAAYQAFDQTGAMVSAGGFRKMVGDVVNEATSLGFDTNLHPQVKGVLQRFAKEVSTSQPVSLQHLDTLRRITRGVSRATGQPGGALPNLTDHERTIVDAMVDQLDDFTESLLANPRYLAGTTPQVAKKALEHLSEGRKLNQLWRRSEMLDDMWERAGIRSGQQSMAGMENSLRTEFRQLATRMTRNKGLKRMFSEDERKAISSVASPTHAENAAKQVGKLAPNNIFSLGLGAGGGYFGDPLFTAGLWGVGGLGKGASYGLTANRFNQARNALLGQPLYSYPYTPTINPLAASAAMNPLRKPQ